MMIIIIIIIIIPSFSFKRGHTAGKHVPLSLAAVNISKLLRTIVSPNEFEVHVYFIRSGSIS